MHKNLHKNLHISKFFSIFAQNLRKVEEMKDYQLTSDGLYAYQYPRVSVKADAVLFAEKDGQIFG